MTTANILSQLGSAGVSTGFKNKFINGGFYVWQRGTSSSSGGYSTADRWYASGTGTFTVSKSANPTSPNNNYYLNWVTGASSSYVNMGQCIESVNIVACRNQLMTVSAWVQLAAGSFTGALVWGVNTNTVDAINLSNSVTLISYNTITPTATWQQVTATFIVPSTCVSLSCFLNNSNVQASGVSVNMADAQIEVGGVPTNFDVRDFGSELDRCQRYFEKSFDYATAPAHAVGGLPVLPIGSNLGCGGNAYWVIPMKTNKRSSSYTIRWYDPLVSHPANENWIRAITACDSGTAYGPNSYMQFNSCNSNQMGGYSQVGSSIPPIFYWTVDAEL